MCVPRNSLEPSTAPLRGFAQNGLGDRGFGRGKKKRVRRCRLPPEARAQAATWMAESVTRMRVLA